jgi:hypothetical protein
MTTTRRRRVLASLLLAALLFVPLTASAHHHATSDRTTPCATCAVAHTPAAVAPALRVPTTALLVVGVEVAPAAAPADPTIGRATGRGPPAILLTQGA